MIIVRKSDSNIKSPKECNPDHIYLRVRKHTDGRVGLELLHYTPGMCIWFELDRDKFLLAKSPCSGEYELAIALDKALQPTESYTYEIYGFKTFGELHEFLDNLKFYKSNPFQSGGLFSPI